MSCGRFPRPPLPQPCRLRKAVAVIDQNLAPGLGGITYQEIAAALYDSPARPPLLSIVGGLGGKDISEAEFDAVAHDLSGPQLALVWSVHACSTPNPSRNACTPCCASLARRWKREGCAL